MAEVPDHLVPTDGLTNSTIRYAGFDAIPGKNGAQHRFDFFDEQGSRFGTFHIETAPTPQGTIDSLVVEAHRQLTDVLRQWLHVTDRMRAEYEKKEPRQ